MPKRKKLFQVVLLWTAKTPHSTAESPESNLQPSCSEAATRTTALHCTFFFSSFFLPKTFTWAANKTCLEILTPNSCRGMKRWIDWWFRHVLRCQSRDVDNLRVINAEKPPEAQATRVGKQQQQQKTKKLKADSERHQQDTLSLKCREMQAADSCWIILQRGGRLRPFGLKGIALICLWFIILSGMRAEAK